MDAWWGDIPTVTLDTFPYIMSLYSYFVQYDC